MLEMGISQRQIADKLNITPQALTKILNKKNFGFDDAKRLLDALDHELFYEFKKAPAD